MLFQLKILQNDTLKQWYFDSVSFYFYDENKNPINQRSSWPSNIKKITNDHYEVGDIDISNLVIYMGSHCNYKCGYCPQIKFRGQVHDAKPTDVPQFIEAIKNNLDLNKLRLIAISGGEPLVYWKTVKQLVPFFNENCPNLVNFRMITNGALLTDEIIQWCKTNKLRVVVSDDGGTNQYRHKRSFEQTKELFQKYNRYAKILGNDFVIRYQLGKHHLDAVKMYQYFKKHMPDLQCIADQGVIETVMPDDDQSKTMVTINSLTKNQLHLLSDSRYQSLLDHNKEQQNTSRRLNALIRSIKNGTNYATPYRCENMYMREMHVDLLGNVLKCMWVPTFENNVGHLNDLHNVHYEGYTGWDHRDACYKCPLVSLCKGVCPLATNHTVQTSCHLMYADQLAYFKAAIKKLWNVNVVSIEPIEHQPNAITSIFNERMTNYQDIENKVRWEFDGH